MVLVGGEASLMWAAPQRYYNMLKTMLAGGPMIDAFEPVLQSYGVRSRSDLLAVHERMGDPNDEAEDFVEQARRNPPIFVLNDFGDHPVTSPVYSLDAAFVPLQPVELVNPPPAGTKVTRIIPLPTSPASWGEKDIESVRRGKPTLDPQAGDQPG